MLKIIKKFKCRFFEILPGAITWLTFILAVAISFWRPIEAIFFIIIFDLLWLVKVYYLVIHQVTSWSRFRHEVKINWLIKLKNLKNKNWQDYFHLIFLPTYKESFEVIDGTFDNLAGANYDTKKFIVVLAGEARDQSYFLDLASKIEKKYQDKFFKILITVHPQNLPGEIPGKGSNLNYSENEMRKYIDAKGWDYGQVIATIFDIDTVCHSQYFACLTYLYCKHPRPTRSSFQPIALYDNNIWESPAVLRIMAFGTTFWIMTSLARQDSLVTFSSHSMSFRAIVDAGYHEKRIVSEDSRIFFQCLLAYDGDYEVTPIYLPVSMDTVRDDKWLQSVKNLYRQRRRWAWGVEQIPYLLYEFCRVERKKFPLWKKIKWLFVEWEGKWSWCMVALIITLLGRLPMWVASEDVRQSALFFNAPYILETLMIIAMSGMLLSAALSLPLLPKSPLSQPAHKYIIMLLQWLLLPFSLIFVSAIPAIDAVTHLMAGKYLGFNISQKKRK